MDINNQEYERYQRAQKRVQEIKGFYGHLTSFIVVMLFLVFINLRYSPEYLWFFWPLLGWGIGLVSHGFKAFDYSPFLGKEWEERKLKQFLEEENNKTKWQ